MKSRLRYRPWANGGTRKEKVRRTNKTNEFTLASVGAQGESESICATLWDAIWVVWLLALLCLLHLQWIQVAVHQLGMKTLEDRGIRNKSPLKKKKQYVQQFSLFILRMRNPFQLLDVFIGQAGKDFERGKKLRVRRSLQVFKCPLEDRSALSDWAVEEIDDLNKACWKQKRMLNKAYIRTWASGEQWARGVHLKDNPNGREKRLYVCMYLNMHQSVIRRYL